MRIQTWRFLLLAAAWILAAISLPLRRRDLNGFFAWRGTVFTQFFLRFILALPRALLEDYLNPAALPAAMGAHIAPSFDTAALDLAWLAAAITGLALFALAPIFIYRIKTLRAQTTLRCVLPAMLVIPLTTLAPISWRYPIPYTGMYLLAAAHLLAATALALAPKLHNPPTHAFPISVKQ